MRASLRLQNSKYGHTGCVNTVLWNHAGTRLISSGDDVRINVWRPNDASLRIRLQDDDGESDSDSDTSEHAAAATSDSDNDDEDDDDVDDWWDCDDIRNGRGSECLLSLRTSHQGNVFFAGFMPFTDDRQIVSCAADGVIRVFDLNKQSVLCAQWNSTARDAGGGETIELTDRQVLIRAFSQHDSMVHKLAFEPGNPFVILSASGDGTSRLFDLRVPANQTGEVLVDLRPNRQAGRRETVDLNAISVNELHPNIFVVGGGDEFVRIYDRRVVASPGNNSRLECVKQFAPQAVLDKTNRGSRGYPLHITGVRFDSWNNRVLASYSGEKIYLFDANDAQPIVDEHSRHVHNNFLQSYEGHRSVRTVKEVSFMGPRNEFVISGSDDGRVFFWNTESGQLVNISQGDKHVVNGLAPHPEGAPILATSGIEHDVKIWTPCCNTTRSKDMRKQDRIKRANERQLNRAQRSVGIPSGLILSLLTALAGPRRSRGTGGGTGEDEGGDRTARLRAFLAQLASDSDEDEDEDEDDADEEDNEEDAEEGFRVHYDFGGDDSEDDEANDEDLE